MNSKFNTENFINLYKSLDHNSKKELLNWALKYNSALNKNNVDETKKIYSIFLNIILNAEKKTNIKVITSPNDSYILALSACAGFIKQRYDKVRLEQIKKQVKEKIKQELHKIQPVSNSVQFSNIEAANKWLLTQHTIVVNSVDINSSSKIGFFANHSVTNSVVIKYTDYKKSVGYVYGIYETELTSFFKRKNPKKYIEEWKKTNPKLEVVDVQGISNSRGDNFTLYFGFGSNYAEHVKLYITYRTKIIPIK